MIRSLLAVGSVLFIALGAPAGESAPPPAGVQATVERWDTWEAALQASRAYANPFTDVDVTAIFTYEAGGKTLTVCGFHDGGATWRIRFMPTEPGTWNYVTKSSDPGLGGKAGRLTCVPPKRPYLHGPLAAQGFHFVHADGTRRLLVSTRLSCPFAPPEVWPPVIEFLKAHRVNRVFFMMGGVSGTFKELYGDGGDFSRYNVEKFRAIDAFVDALRRSDIVASPYFYYFNDKVQRKMTPDQDRAYLRYGMARFGAYANVMPVLSNEVEQKATERRGQYDPAAHAWANKMGPYLVSQAVFGLPVTVHNPMETEKAVRPGFYTLLADWPFPWACCMLRQAQVGALGAAPALSDDVPEQKNPVYNARAYARHNALLIDLRRFKVPVINEEPGYEMGPPRKAGDKVLPWNSQTSETLLPTFWTAAAAGAYAVWGSAGTYETGDPLAAMKASRMPGYLKVLHDFVAALPYWEMAPANDAVSAAETTVEGGAYRTNFCLAKADEAYLVFSLAGGAVTVNLAPGAAYDAIQLDPRTGKRTDLGRVDGGSRGFTLSGPEQVLLCRRVGAEVASEPVLPEPKAPPAAPSPAVAGTYYPPPESAGGWRSLVPPNKTPSADQKRAIRQAAGLDWDKLRAAWDYCESFGDPDSLLVIRHGWVAAEWHNTTEARGIASCTKSLTSLAMARLFDLSDAGRLPQPIGPDDEASRWLPASWAEAEPARRQIRLRHMLTMTSGLTPYDGPYKQDYPEQVFAQKVESPPGEVWAYASVPVDMLSLILERASGRTLADFFNAEICAPIGAAAVTWGRFGEHTGGSGGPQGGARFPPRDLARVGYMVLHDGAWQRDGKTFQVISADRLKQMTRWAPVLENAKWRQPNFAFEPNANQFYGHLWWTNRTGQGLGTAAPRDAVYMSGWGKQACVVVPSLDMVVVRLGPNRALNDHPEFYLELWSRIMAAVAVDAEPPAAVPTFECIGLYWKAPGGAADKTCEVRYRPAGTDAWANAMPLWFDARDGEYRGSIVQLKPGTAYEIALALQGTPTCAALTCVTWKGTFPVAETVAVPVSSAEALAVNRSGTANGYVLYAPPAGAKMATLDVGGERDQCVVVTGSYVILRGLVLKNARIHGIQLMDGVHDVVIEECDISGWGRIAEDGWGRNLDSAVYSRATALQRIVVQRNRIHHPRSNSNNWRESRPRPGKKEPNHPEGPQAVSFFDSEGNHVIRYNTVFSDDTHQYNDIFGGGANFSTRGFPHRDSDIYGNLLSHCWDDAIESEGANCNVRIWGNYMTDTFVGIACATTSVGPLYVWRNVVAVSRVSPGGNGGGFLKTSDRLGGGRIYVFHNTVLQPPAPPGAPRTLLGADMGMGWGGPMVNVTSRNNILHANRRAIVDRAHDPLADYDYDLYSAALEAAEGQEKHGAKGVPVYAPGGGMKDGKGVFALAPGSPGFDAGVRLPNFNDAFQGSGPDVGAHEAGTPSMEFGADAYRVRP